MLGGIAACALSGAAHARIYADTVNTVGESLDEIRAKGRLKVAVYEDFAPFSVDGQRQAYRHRLRYRGSPRERPSACGSS